MLRSEYSTSVGKRVDDVVSEGYQDKDEEGVEELHLVRVHFEQTQNVAIHLLCLDCPCTSLLVETHEENSSGQQNHKKATKLRDLIQETSLKRSQ